MDAFSRPLSEPKPEAESGNLTLAAAITKYLEQTRVHKSRKTFLAYRVTLVLYAEYRTAIKLTRKQRSNAEDTYSGDVQIVRALKAGAQGYLLKGLLRKELLDTIRSVYKGKKRVSPEVASEIAEYAADSALTLREIDVLHLIAEGCANKIVADRLSITEDTVKAHVRNILSKLGANDRTHAVTIALKRGIIDL